MSTGGRDTGAAGPEPDRPAAGSAPPRRPMQPRPRDEMADHVGRGLLEGEVALVTGG
jgi:hypothetical protein